MPKILVTGFDAFGGAEINASWEVVRSLTGVVTAQIPTAYKRAIPTLLEQLDQHQPQAILCVGQAAGRAQILLERVALNLNDSPQPDNDGVTYRDTPIIEGGPAAYFSSLPLRMIQQRLQQENIPVTLSNTAGTYLCNHLFYGVRHHSTVPAGFIHIPVLPQQATYQQPNSLPEAVIRQGLIIAIAAISEHLNG
jgi:pyroglutamyl-peptidase